MAAFPVGPDGKRTERNRAEAIEAGDGVPELPEAPEYLLVWLRQLGVCSRGAGGLVPLTASEVLAWSQATGHRLQAWEFEALLDASRAFADEYHADNHVAPDGQEVPRPSLSNQLRNLTQKVNGR